MKYKVGDKVRVRKDLTAGVAYGRYVTTSEMRALAGKVVTIVDTHGAGRESYAVAEQTSGNHWWTDEMFEGLAEDTKFKVGDRVKVNELGKTDWGVLKNKGVDFGTIIHIKKFSVGVEFDKNFGGHSCDDRCKDGHGFWLTEDEIDLIEEEPKEEWIPTPVININVIVNNYENACWYCRKGGLVDLYLEGAMGICPNCKRVCNDTRKGFTLTNSKVIEFTAPKRSKRPKRKNRPLTDEEFQALPVGTKLFIVWCWDMASDCKGDPEWEDSGWGVKNEERCVWKDDEGCEHRQTNYDYHRCFDAYLEEPERPIPEPDDEILF